MISSSIRKKLTQKHGVNEAEITQCFTSRERAFLEDTRENHKTDPPTKWFIAETDFGRCLKVVFMQSADGQDIQIKTAYLANIEERRIYEKYAPKI
ncbi:MAG: ADP-ribosyl-(dinitrogen reductase) hydrolase [Thiohalomonadales bacterium]